MNGTMNPASPSLVASHPLVHQLDSAGSVDDEVERIMLEELARAEADDAVGQTRREVPPRGSYDPTISDQRELPTVKSVEFGKLERTEFSGNPKNLDILMDVKLPVSIELGRTEMAIRDILDLAAGWLTAHRNEAAAGLPHSGQNLAFLSDAK
jgi:flagellar motor switch/type III secretory pathway protein FliN